MKEGTICGECALENGGIWREGHLATFWIEKCDLCNKEKTVCATTDWSWNDRQSRSSDVSPKG